MSCIVAHVDTLFGFVDIGPRFLVASESSPVDNLPQVYRTGRALVLPLNYKRCKRRLKRWKKGGVEGASTVTAKSATTRTGFTTSPNISNVENIAPLSKQEQAPARAPCSAPLRKLHTLERTLQHMFGTGCYYYSTEIDITRLEVNGKELGPSVRGPPNEFWFNAFMVKFLLPVFTPPTICGYVGAISYENSLLILVSKKSNLRPGWRYMRRGVDDFGNVANFVETTQILVRDGAPSAEFTIVRGSIPLFFKQDHMAGLVLERNSKENRDKFALHMSKLRKRYGPPTLLSLVSSTATEGKLGTMYQQMAQCAAIPLTWFDFHRECGNLHYRRVEKMFTPEMDSMLRHMAWNSSKSFQKGILRVNCIDCLDRTNVVQKAICQRVLSWQTDSLPPEKDYGALWANNGDNLATMYANTNAMKRDFTKSGKRGYSGLIHDGLVSLQRLYYALVVDYYQQAVLDFALGEISQNTFWAYHSLLENMDPNREGLREVTRRNVVMEVERNGGQVIGAWWVSVSEEDMRNWKSMHRSAPIQGPGKDQGPDLSDGEGQDPDLRVVPFEICSGELSQAIPSLQVPEKTREEVASHSSSDTLGEAVLLITPQHTHIFQISERNHVTYANALVSRLQLGEFYTDWVTPLGRDPRYNVGALIDVREGPADPSTSAVSDLPSYSRTWKIRLKFPMGPVGPFGLKNEAIEKALIGAYEQVTCEHTPIADARSARRHTPLLARASYALKSRIWGARAPDA